MDLDRQLFVWCITRSMLPWTSLANETCIQPAVLFQTIPHLNSLRFHVDFFGKWNLHTTSCSFPNYPSTETPFDFKFMLFIIKPNKCTLIIDLGWVVQNMYKYDFHHKLGIKFILVLNQLDLTQ
jgi:hypothetical protein